MTTVQPRLSSPAGDESTEIDSSGGSAGARDEPPSLTPSYVEHMQHMVESFDRWNDAARLLDTSTGRV